MRPPPKRTPSGVFLLLGTITAVGAFLAGVAGSPAAAQSEQPYRSITEGETTSFSLPTPPRQECESGWSREGNSCILDGIGERTRLGDDVIRHGLRISVGDCGGPLTYSLSYTDSQDSRISLNGRQITVDTSAGFDPGTPYGPQTISIEYFVDGTREVTYEYVSGSSSSSGAYSFSCTRAGFVSVLVEPRQRQGVSQAIARYWPNDGPGRDTTPPPAGCQIVVTYHANSYSMSGCISATEKATYEANTGVDIDSLPACPSDESRPAAGTRCVATN